jgi:hypothetical protein
MTDVLLDHRRACDGFTEIVAGAGGRWDRQSPCTEWDARGVLEHVIGFHDALLLVPWRRNRRGPKTIHEHNGP